MSWWEVQKVTHGYKHSSLDEGDYFPKPDDKGFSGWPPAWPMA